MLFSPSKPLCFYRWNLPVAEITVPVVSSLSPINLPNPSVSLTRLGRDDISSLSSGFNAGASSNDGIDVVSSGSIVSDIDHRVGIPIESTGATDDAGIEALAVAPDLRRVSSGRPRRVSVQCPECPQMVLSGAPLRLHIDVVYRNKRYTCSDCSIKYTTLPPMCRHLRTTNHKNYTFK